jgi:hypothetical protein
MCVWVGPVCHNMPMVGACNRLEHFRMDSGIIVAGKTAAGLDGWRHKDSM